MHQLNIEIVEYQKEKEAELIKRLYTSKSPMVIKMRDFPENLDLDYYAKAFSGNTSYTRYDDDRMFLKSSTAPFPEVLKWIKQNQPVRIFGQVFAEHVNEELVKSIPIWSKIPFRPRYFKPSLGKAVYFFGGKGSVTNIHYDRELNSNLHICIHGKKRVLLFNESENRKIYKLPLKSDSAINFTKPVESLLKTYPELENAEYYDVTLSPGDMLLMPKNCWHHIEYIDHNASATFAFYPRKIDQLLGLLTGSFYLGFSFQGLRIDNSRLYHKFAHQYIYSTGIKRSLLKFSEAIMAIALFPLCSITTVYNFVLLKKRPY